MKITPLSGDLLLKIGLLAIGVGVAVWAVRRASTAATDAAGAALGQAGQVARDAAWAVTPWNNQNVVYDSLNRAIWPDGSETLGTAAFQLGDDVARWWNDLTGGGGWTKPAPQAGWSTGQGRWNNPSAYVAPVDSMAVNPDALSLTPYAYLRR